MVLTVAKTSIEEVRNLAIDLGYERDRHKAQGDEIAERIRQLAVEAKRVGMSRAELARLLGIDRTNLYKVYLDD